MSTNKPEITIDRRTLTLLMEAARYAASERAADARTFDREDMPDQRDIAEVDCTRWCNAADTALDLLEPGSASPY